MILSQSDRIMIGRFCGEAQAGIYSVACYLQTGVTVIISAVNSAFVPWLYERLEKKEYHLIRQRTDHILFFLGLLAFGIVSCSPELIHLMAPEKYYEAIWVVPPVVIGAYFTILYMFCANVEIYYEKRFFLSFATMGAAGLNIILNYWMIPYFGYIACAYTTLFCYLVYGLAHYFFMNRIKAAGKQVKSYHIYSIRRILLVYGVTAILSFLQMTLFNAVLLRYAVAGLVSLILIFFWRKKCLTKKSVN